MTLVRYRHHLVPIGVMLMSASACSQNPVSVDQIILSNGVSVGLVAGHSKPSPCIALGEVIEPKSAAAVELHCVEAPLAGSTTDPMNIYASVLRESGFDFAGGAGPQYWLEWPEGGDCKRRLNLTALPKEKIEGDDWSGMKTMIVLFEFYKDSTCGD
ncbi:MAG: hypothetical protein CMK07_12335 [Ponticaulis sp.]|nr:hypothetical protein [Ponticaulis sp.]